MNKKIETFIETLKLRHSDYTLKNGSVLSEKEFIDFIKKCINYHPSAFNVQSTRVVLLIDKYGADLWQHVISNLPKEFPELLLHELDACKSGYATMLFYDDTNVTKASSELYHMSLTNFESWALQSMAMLQSVLWNGLSYLGYGVNIQHFNKEIEQYAYKELNIPKHWKLLAQMCVGEISKKTPPHDRLPAEKLLVVHK